MICVLGVANSRMRWRQSPQGVQRCSPGHDVYLGKLALASGNHGGNGRGFGA